MAVVEYKGRKNQTELHQKLALSPMGWAANKATRKGMRFATEFHVFHNYIVDAAILMTFQWRFAEAYGLIERKPESPYVAYYEDAVCLFEAKQSIQDFKKDFSPSGFKGKNPKGTLNWVVTPKGLVSPGEVPGIWGLLEMRGNGLTEIKAPVSQKIETPELQRIGYEMLWKGGRGSQYEDRFEVGRRIGEAR